MNLEKLDTSPAIIAVLSAMVALRLDPDPTNYILLPPQSNSESILNKAIDEQSHIGFKHLFLGRLSKKWRLAQLFYFREKF